MEPLEGQGGTAKVCFHIGEKRIWRRFDSDDTLAMVINYVSCLEEVVLLKNMLYFAAVIG